MAYKAKRIKNLDKMIGEKITYLRLSLGMTRQDLAEKIGVTHQQLQKYEKATNRITAARLLEIASALQVPVTYFYHTHEEDGPSDIDLKKQRLCLEMMRDFANLPQENWQEALRHLVRVLVA